MFTQPYDVSHVCLAVAPGQSQALGSQLQKCMAEEPSMARRKRAALSTRLDRHWQQAKAVCQPTFPILLPLKKEAVQKDRPPQAAKPDGSWTLRLPRALIMSALHGVTPGFDSQL